MNNRELAETISHEFKKSDETIAALRRRVSELEKVNAERFESYQRLDEKLTVAIEALRNVIIAAERCSCSGYAIKETGGVGYQISEDIQQIAREALAKMEGK